MTATDHLGERTTIDGDWRALAERAGVSDLAGYERCLGSEVAGRRLEEDMRLGDALGVTATPTFFYRFGVHVGYARTRNSSSN